MLTLAIIKVVVIAGAILVVACVPVLERVLVYGFASLLPLSGVAAILAAFGHRERP